MGEEAEERIDVRGDGRIILYKRKGLKNPKWQTRIRVPNAREYKTVTTKTADLFDAKRFALDLYEELYLHVKAGGSVQSKTFRQVYDEWANSQDGGEAGSRPKPKSQTETVERIASYALEFFGARRIDTIRKADFTNYWEWRKHNYVRRAPTNSTLRRERTSILPVFKHALARGYITSLPDTDPPKVKSNRRPTFSSEEWKRIRDKSREWVKEGKGLATWRDRFMAQHCFLVLAYTGLRTGELRDLRWADVHPIAAKDGSGLRYVAGHARGKTGSRQFVFQPGTEVSLKQLFENRTKELQLQFPDREGVAPAPNEPIFCHRDGSPIQSYKHSFEALLAFAKVPIEKDGQRLSPYSLRHFYATRRLSEETNPYLLARQMGTSVEMLEKHYGQVVTTSLAAEITKAAPSGIKFKSDIDFPF